MSVFYLMVDLDQLVCCVSNGKLVVLILAGVATGFSDIDGCQLFPHFVFYYVDIALLSYKRFNRFMPIKTLVTYLRISNLTIF